MTSTDQTIGATDLRSQFFDKTVKGFATAMYKFKQGVTISPTSAWKNYYYREDPDPLTEPSINTTRGIPRGANFPQASVEWQKLSSTIEKYGMEDFVYWEDILSDDIDVMSRTMFRIAERVTKAVDDQIWSDFGGTEYASGDALTSSKGIQTIVLTRSLAGWDQSTGAIIDNLLHAKQLIAEKNYDTSNLMCFVNPKDYRSIMTYIADKGAQFPNFGEQVARNGQAGKLAGIQLVVSNSVSASNALVVVPRVCATWKELHPLTTTTIEDQYIGIKVRSVELGTLQLTDPNACVLITGTQHKA